MTGRLDDLGLQIEIAKLPGNPVGRPNHVVPMRAVDADTGNSQQLAQVFLKATFLLIEILVKRERCLTILNGHGEMVPVDRGSIFSWEETYFS